MPVRNWQWLHNFGDFLSGQFIDQLTELDEQVNEGGGAISVTDGSTTVDPATSLDFTSGATVTDGGSGVAQVAVTGGSQPVFSGEGAPTAPTNPSFQFNPTGDPNASGTFKVTYDGQTTAPISWDATGDEIATALAALSNLGADNAVAYPDYGGSTINDYTYVILLGPAAGAPAELTITEDTTDNGVSVSVYGEGAAGVPAQATASGALYVDTDTTTLYVLNATGGIQKWAPTLPAGWTQSGTAVQGAVDGQLGFADDDSNYVTVSPSGFVSHPPSGAAFTVESAGGATQALNCDGLPVVGLPTADPHIAGALWNDSGTPAISTG